MVEVGSPVIYIDPSRVKHMALVTAVWGAPEPQPSINLVFVTDDPTKTDPYGRQIARETSVVHLSNQSAGAFCWQEP